MKVRLAYFDWSGDAYHDHDLVFCQAIGKPLHMHNVAQKDFRHVMKTAGVPRIHFHGLRHLHASYLVACNI